MPAATGGVKPDPVAARDARDAPPLAGQAARAYQWPPAAVSPGIAARPLQHCRAMFDARNSPATTAAANGGAATGGLKRIQWPPATPATPLHWPGKQPAPTSGRPRPCRRAMFDAQNSPATRPAANGGAATGGVKADPVAARDARDAPPFARRIARRVAADSLGRNGRKRGGMAGKGRNPKKSVALGCLLRGLNPAGWG